MPARKILPKTTVDDDTEGQFMLPNPDMNRHVARVREEEIRRNLRRRGDAFEARRPYNKREHA
jgi:hypothetical protein